MDFYKIVVEKNQDRNPKYDFKIYPDFKHINIKDLVIKGGEFFAYWDGSAWIRDSNILFEKIDADIWAEYDKLKETNQELKIVTLLMDNESSGMMNRWVQYCKKGTQSTIDFNTKVLFASHQIVREDYSTYQLPYDPTPGSTESFDAITSVLYDPEELHKILWSMGALLTGEIEYIEKFLYLYGAKGTGKGTILKIIKQMMGTYWSPIDLEVLTGSSEFATSGVDEVPMLIDSDCDISKIKKEVNLLKLSGHEELMKRKLYQSPYPVTFKGLLVTASNKRFTVRDKDAGIVRRPIVVHPSGRKMPQNEYHRIFSNIKYETAAIAQKCIDTFNAAGAQYYADEVDVSMIAYGDRIFEFMRENYAILKKGTTLNAAGNMYQLYLTDMGWDTKRYKADLKEALYGYYRSHAKEYKTETGERVFNYFYDIKTEEVFPERVERQLKEVTPVLTIEKEEPGIFDIEAKDYPAQYASDNGIPVKKWDEVNTTLKDLEPNRLHYVRVPSNLIVLDFDIKNPETGEKDLQLNLAKASLYPETYSELSQSGGGVHLHYWYDGDVSQLAKEIEEDVEIKTFKGHSTLRRRFTKCNDLPIAHISTGLPLKEEKIVYSEIENIVWTETKLRAFMDSCFMKKHHGATKPELDFIKKVLDDAIKAGTTFDVSDYEPKLLNFAMRSTNQRDYCMALIPSIVTSNGMEDDKVEKSLNSKIIPDEELYFYDVEVFPNLLVICWKQAGPNGERGRWINPSPDQVKWLLSKPLVGFFNRKYDNHIIYNRSLGADNLAIYHQSQNMIIKGTGFLPAAYNLSYADLYEFLDVKKSLKKWEIFFDLLHDEFEYPWDQPLPEHLWDRCVEYCDHDVDATEYVFFSETGRGAYAARKVMSTLTDMSMNSKTQVLAEKMLFGDDPRPQDKFNWYDLATEFPGYKYDEFAPKGTPKSIYLGTDPSEGGHVYAKPGVYKRVVILDIESMHPNSLIAMRYFGPYTDRFAAMVQCRLHIKHGDYDAAIHAFDDLDPDYAEKLRPFLEDPELAEALAHALKIVINIVYGMTSAKYDNKFRDPRNKDNCVAKRGALFMVKLHDDLIKKFDANVIHIKTDSIKLVDPTPEILQYCFDLATEFKYKFAHEHTYDKFFLVNKAVLAGHIEWSHKPKEIGSWEAIGAQFKEPYVYKTLFSGERIETKDFFLLKEAKSPIKKTVIASYNQLETSEDDRFIGKNAYVYASHTGSNIYADRGETKAFITGTKGYLWEMAAEFKGKEDIDMKYYQELVRDGVDNVFSVGDGNIIFEGTKWERKVTPTNDELGIDMSEISEAQYQEAIAKQELPF